MFIKISDSLLSLKTMQSVSEIVILLEKFSLSEKYRLIFYYSVQILCLPLKNNLF